GETVGSVVWMAPEVLRQQPATAASDVFTWGATVAYAATGRRPFGAGPDIGVAPRGVRGPPPGTRRPRRRPPARPPRPPPRPGHPGTDPGGSRDTRPAESAAAPPAGSPPRADRL